MKRLSQLLLLLLFSQLALAQDQIGLHYDADGMPIYDYYDALTYTPETQLSIVYNSDDYEKGAYYDNSGKKHVGFIKFENKKIFFKENIYAREKTKILPTEASSVLVGIDSFFVASNFYVEQKLGESLRREPEFMQHITTFNGYTFARHSNFSSGIVQSFGASALFDTYQVKKGNGNWVSFPRKRKAFAEAALEYFSDVPYLKERIESYGLSYDDMMTLIKVKEYHYKTGTENTVHFGKYWQEVQAHDKFNYAMKLLENKDSIYTVEYSKQDGTLLYRANYSSFYPNTKNGLFTSYYPTGKVRKEDTFKNDDLLESKIYFENGNLAKHYQVITQKIFSYGNYKDKKTVKWIEINDENGTSLLKEGVNGEVITKINGNIIHENFENAKVTSAYRGATEKTYLFTNFDKSLNISGLQKKLSLFFVDKEYSNAINENSEGKLLVLFTINEKGKVIEHKVLNRLHSEINTWVNTFLENYCNSSYSNFKFKKNTLAGEKVAYEVVIPISFSINRFYRQSANYYYDPFFMQNHFQMQNQMMMNNIPKPPVFNGF